MSKLTTAWKAFWSILSSQEKADAWNSLAASGKQLPPPSDSEETAGTGGVPANDGAVHALAILQRESRLIDFLMEDLSECDDEQIGAAVRKIHDDSQAALVKYFEIKPVHNAAEGDTVSVPASFDNRRIRLTGKPVGEPPYKGTLVHRGWLASNVRLPAVSAAVDASVIAPAEIEVG
ncbi:MAG: DUF2760 domain-containing protein [Victivallales bacterium]|nr:DUF2760 domain-containing protein [Victivallales bacterium]